MALNANKLREYEELVSETLLPLEQSCRKAYDALLCELDDMNHLNIQLELFAMRPATASEPIKLLSDVGEGYRMHARLDDTSRVCVQVGSIAAGQAEEQKIYLQFSLDEARVFVSKQITGLQRRISVSQSKLERISADITSAKIAISSLSK